MNQTNSRNSTPVTLASVYDLSNQTKLVKSKLFVLIDSGVSHRMAKASLVMKYKDSFFKQSKASYNTAAGMFKSKYSMKLMITLNKFGRGTKINHDFNLDKSKEGIGYDMIIGRDLLNQLNINVRFSNGTIKWEDQVVPMEKFQRIWKNNHPLRKEIRTTILRLIKSRSTKDATERVVKILDLKYKKANLNKIVEAANNLNQEQKHMLLKLLK